LPAADDIPTTRPVGNRHDELDGFHHLGHHNGMAEPSETTRARSRAVPVIREPLVVNTDQAAGPIDREQQIRDMYARRGVEYREPTAAEAAELDRRIAEGDRMVEEFYRTHAA
jgi:hypothetical protein